MALTTCEKCGALITTVFPLHYCKPKKKKKRAR